MIHIQEPESPWEFVYMDWVTALPPNGDKRYNACLVIVERYSKTPIFLPCHKDDTAMDTALLLWNRVISHTVLFENIISDRDPKFKSALWTNLHRLFGTKLSFSTAYHLKLTPGKISNQLSEIDFTSHRDNINCHMCQMRMSLKSQTHFHTIRNVWVITPHGATQQFGMPIFVQEKTSAPPPGHLTPLPYLLSRLNWIPNPHLILSNA
ncbi:hypothetical protein O181_056907 [Austropuccinia psidii MF-1]|uniref:Integrase catalytic domain-containing protein n=1 Tax=Austropuccinia psidii MF-1 TaxID=1389203 RepID=A0A9Q3EBP6_9BASI|nr:hypothetical protein [Austropuccinia psidii MF-1]